MPPNPFHILQRLASLQNLSIAQDINTVVDRLQSQLEHYAELEFRSDAKRIDLITLSDDPATVNKFLTILQDRGATETGLAPPQNLLRFGAGKTVGMKLPIAGPIIGGEIYIRGALPIAEVSYFLKQHDVNSETREQISTLAQVFDKNHTHMLGADVAKSPGFTVFFTAYLKPGNEQSDQQRIQSALQTIGITDAGIADFLPLHHLLGANRPKTLFFSCPLFNGALTKQAKVDYADVRLGLVSTVLDEVGATTQSDIPIHWGTQLGLPKANYAGVVIGSTGPVAVRAYFTRRLPKLKPTPRASF